MKKLISILLGSLFLTCALSSSAIACTIEISSLRKDFRRSNSVFIGEVLNVEVATLPPEAKYRLPKSWQTWDVFSTIRFKVLKSWKGTDSNEKEFLGVAYYDCGCPDAKLDEFKPGEQYLVFAKNKGFITVCESQRVGTEYVKGRIERLGSFWFRTFATIFPF